MRLGTVVVNELELAFPELEHGDVRGRADAERAQFPEPGA